MMRHWKNAHPLYYRLHMRVLLGTILAEFTFFVVFTYTLRNSNLPMTTVSYVVYPLLAVEIGALGFGYRRIMERIRKSWKETGPG